MKTILTLMSICVSGLFFGQSGGYNYIAGNDRSWQDMQIGTVYKEVPIEGSRYTDEIYKMGLASFDGKKIRLLMRYDAYNDQIELIDSKQKSFNLLKRDDIGAEFEGKTYKAVEIQENGSPKLVYANPLNKGNVVLYFKPRKVFVQAQKPENGYDDYDPPRFKDDNIYLIQRKGETAKEIRLNKGSLLKHMRDKNRAVKAFIGERNLDLRTENGAVMLINYYNSLSQGS